MAKFSAQELPAALGNGLLSFPVTHFTADLSFDEKAFRAHVEYLDSFPVAGLFAAGGTGEFFSLQNSEVLQVLRATVESTAAETPVLAPAGRNIKDAIELIRGAEQAGADGVLLLPPYLTEASQEGLYEYVKAVAQSTDLGIIIYSRANAVYRAETVARLAAELPNLIGYKDGVGDIELMTRVFTKLGDRLLYIGGLPTAETFALPYLELGVSTYSSAMFNFVPQFALDFYAAVRARDHDTVYRGLRDFVLPYIAIRDNQPGYGVSIVKAGLESAGRSGGPVRPPLTNLTVGEQAELDALVSTVSAGMSSARVAS
ncbi:5-dehydro-4-deoxyglucarate dehydratase [Salinibacterium sp. ZJ450]|uniref:5-dehydro-4-deoxyglucarate dehydratase n=1 Tax=Salinibacterium sp. ZJ450 TaxID=2708338 RepID=UPI0014216EBE|nr:5-dehydro-4-deoxyglucarate dehydratase [Salinibacterium sp. ZJ450]